MKTLEITIKGLAPGLLMHKYPLEPIEALEKKTKEEQAELAAYRIPGKEKGELYIPGTAIQRALVGGAAYSKGKGRASLQKQVAACVMVSPEYVGLGKTTFDIDSRPVVVPATRGRVIRHRPLIPEWAATFTLEYDETLLTGDQVRRIVDDTGQRVGLLEFRPERKGPFGRFVVIKWPKA